MLIARGDVDLAIESCDRALGVDEIARRVGRGEAMRWKGHALRRRGDVAEARRWYIRALSLFFALGAKREENEVREELGRLEKRLEARS